MKEKEKKGFNPCLCWNLKDGCITVGIWTLIFAAAQLGIFGWQMREIQWYKNQAGMNTIPNYGVQYNSYYQGRGAGRYQNYYERYYQTGAQRFYTGLFVLQILFLIVSFFLFFASIALIYGIRIGSKHLIWPWFPCAVVSILLGAAYCIMWWAGNVTSYWVVLTVIELIGALINGYCLVCVIAWFRRIGQEASEDSDKGTVDTLVYTDRNEPGGATAKLHYYGRGEKLPQRQFNSGYDPYPREPYPYSQGYRQAGELPRKQSAPEDGYARYGRPTPAPPGYGTGPRQAGTNYWPARDAGNRSQELPLNAGYQQPPPDEGAHTEPSTPTKAFIPKIHPSRSVPEVPERLLGQRYKHRRRSSSVGSQRSLKMRTDSSYADSSTTSSPGDSDSDWKRRQRSRSRDRHMDSDPGYSDRKRRRKHRRRHSRSRDRDYEDRRGRERETERGERSRRRRPREVKRGRGEKERGERERQAPPVPARPDGIFKPGGGGAISLPTTVVIPKKKPGEEDKPQRYKVNSEITISYSDKGLRLAPSADGGEPGESGGYCRPRVNGGPKIMPLADPRITSPAEGEEEEGRDLFRTSFGSTDSRAQGSTAV